MPTADDLERRTAEYLEMLRQIRGGNTVAVNPDTATPMTAVMKSDDPLEKAAFQAALDLLATEAAGGKAAAEDSPAAARAALESADELLGTVAGIVEQVGFKGDVQVDGWRAGVVIETAKLDVAAAHPGRARGGSGGSGLMTPDEGERRRDRGSGLVPPAEWERRRSAGVCVDCAGPLQADGLRCRECLAGIARQKTAWRRWGTAVSELLRERGWTQKQLAAAVRVSPDALALTVRHGCELDTWAVRRIADALQIVDVDALFLTPVQRRACDAIYGSGSGAGRMLKVEIVDEVGTPWLTFRTTCDACGAVISESRLSALDDQAQAGPAGGGDRRRDGAGAPADLPRGGGDGGRGKTVNTRQNPVVRFLVAAALAVAL